MSVYLGSIEKLKKYPSYQDIEKLITPKLLKIEYEIIEYYKSRVYDKKISAENVLQNRGFSILTQKWNKEVENILRKNGYVAKSFMFPYDIGDVLA
jgi:hypothetical protein